MTDAAGVLVMRVAWGALLLIAPQRLLTTFHRGDAHLGRARWVLRVLGARHLAQTALELAGPRPASQYVGAAVDGVHALTGVGLAAVDRRWRRSAVMDATIAAGFAVATSISTRRSRSAAPAAPEVTR